MYFISVKFFDDYCILIFSFLKYIYKWSAMVNYEFSIKVNDRYCKIVIQTNRSLKFSIIIINVLGLLRNYE